MRIVERFAIQSPLFLLPRVSPIICWDDTAHAPTTNHPTTAPDIGGRGFCFAQSTLSTMQREGGCQHRANANKQTRTSTSPEVLVMPTRDCYQTPTAGGDRHNMAGSGRRSLDIRLLICSSFKGDPICAFYVACSLQMILLTQTANIATTTRRDYRLLGLSWVRVDTRSPHTHALLKRSTLRAQCA